MTRAWWVAAVCLVFGAVPVAAQSTGSVRIQGGLSASGPGLAGTASLLAHFGSFSVGPELGAAGLGDDGDVWHLGGVFGLGSSAEGIHPRATLGVARYSWKPGEGWVPLGIFGVSLGVGAWITRPGSGLSPGAELRWHHQLQDVGAGKELSFVTLTVGLASHW